MDKISAIIPIYKGKKYIQQLLKSFYNNYMNLKGIVDLEIIFINDYPQEEISESIIGDDCTNKLNISFYNNTENVGIHGTRVKGLDYATGNIIFFLDQDDQIEDNYLVSQYEVLKNNDVVLCNGYQKLENEKYKIYNSNFHMEKAITLSTYKMWNEIVSPGQCLIRKEIIPEFWKDNILKNNGSDDYFLWVLLLCNNCKFVLNSRLLYYHCLTENNFSKNRDKMIISNLMVCDYLKKYNRQAKKIAIHQEKFLKTKIGNEYSVKDNIKSIINFPIICINRMLYSFLKKLYMKFEK